MGTRRLMRVKIGYSIYFVAVKSDEGALEAAQKALAAHREAVRPECHDEKQVEAMIRGLSDLKVKYISTLEE